MTGKERCEFLRNIRKNIAELNDLDYEPHECTHEGWCPGYCPACDAESADLLRQLEKKEAAGATIKIDVESIKGLEDMAKETKDIDDDFDDEECPGEIRSEMGDIIEPLNPDGQILGMEGSHNPTLKGRSELSFAEATRHQNAT